jgi:hypothetical protein
LKVTHMSRIKKYFAISLITIISLSGCGAHQDLENMQQAKAAYQACLAANPQDPAACKKEKEAYETAGEAYESLRP